MKSNRITTQSATLLDVLKEYPDGINVYDGRFPLHITRWTLPMGDIDSLSALIWMMAERIDVVSVADDGCDARISSFVESNYDFIHIILENRYSPKFSDDPQDRTYNLELGVEVIQNLILGNLVQFDCLRFIAHLDPFIQCDIQKIIETEEVQG